jgi:beta-fructofuranosidase
MQISNATTRREFLKAVSAATIGGAAAMPWLAFGQATRPTVDNSEDTIAALRRKVAADRHRPQYHIVPPAHFLNDPNGMLYWKGRYHVFYQYAPGGGMMSTKYWYHVVSEDCVHWRNLGVGIAPTPGGPDKDGCWSGSAVVHNSVPTLVYTGAFFIGESERADRANGLIPERQMVAVAADPNDPDLLKWNKIPENPVIAAPPEGMTVSGWRDPALWKEGDTWYMVIGSGTQQLGGAALMYRSKDLRKWEYLHPLASARREASPGTQPVAGRGGGGGGGGGGMWECPDFFFLKGKPVLMSASGNRYLTGTYNDLRFTQDGGGGQIDYGSAYAQKTMEDGQGRRLWFGWVREGGAPQDAGWSGAISLPRILTLRDDGTMNIEPIPELKSLRGSRHAVQNLTVTENSPLLLNDMKGDCAEIVAQIDPGSATEIGVRVRSTADGNEQTLIGYNRTNGTIFSDSSKSNANQGGAPASRGGGGGGRGGTGGIKSGDLKLAEKELVQLHIFLDASVIETFGNNRAGIIDRIYPSSAEALGIGLFAKGGSAVVQSMEIWDLKPISNDRLTSGPLI